MLYESQFVGDQSNNYPRSDERENSLMDSGISVAETLLNGPNIPNEVSSFEWRNVSLTPLKGGKPIVAASYGAARKGEIIAIIGPKDSGKTTLIKLLAQKIPIFAGRRQGEFSINSCKFKSEYLE